MLPKILTKSNINDYERLYDEVNVIIPFLKEKRSGKRYDGLIMIYVYNIDSGNEYIVNYTHKDVELSKLDVKFKNSFVFNEDSVGYGYDLELYYWWLTEETFPDISISNIEATKRILKHNFNYQRVPFSILIKYARNIKNIFLGKYDLLTDYNLFVQYHDYVYKIFKYIETPGCKLNIEHIKVKTKIKSNVIFPNYKLYTSTGRPSNTRLGVNLAALNKDDGSRNLIIGRDNSFLLEFDYSSFHIRLISKLINYKLPKGNLHEYFGRQYFNTPLLSEEQYNQSKDLSFRLSYGSVPEDFMYIKFFKELHVYRENLYKEYEKNKFIRSVIYQRPIGLGKNLPENKLFNYLLQSYETEYNSIILNQLYNYLFNKKSHILLYTYDSFLFNINIEEKDIINDLKNIIYQDEMVGTIKYGTNYGNMKKR